MKKKIGFVAWWRGFTDIYYRAHARTALPHYGRVVPRIADVNGSFKPCSFRYSFARMAYLPSVGEHGHETGAWITPATSMKQFCPHNLHIHPTYGNGMRDNCCYVDLYF